MRRLLLVAMLLSSVGCSRGVTVETAPAPVPQVSIKVTNRADQAITVYVELNGSELTLRQVSANSTEILSVPGATPGATVKLRAALADGSRSYRREGVVLNGVYEWQVP